MIPRGFIIARRFGWKDEGSAYRYLAEGGTFCERSQAWIAPDEETARDMAENLIAAQAATADLHIMDKDTGHKVGRPVYAIGVGDRVTFYARTRHESGLRSRIVMGVEDGTVLVRFGGHARFVLRHDEIIRRERAGTFNPLTSKETQR